MDDKLLYSTQELTTMLGMSKTTILKAVKNGDLKASLYGNKFYFTKEDINEFIKNIRGSNVNSREKI